MATKYVKARLPGRELIHLVPAAGLRLDQRFGDGSEFVEGWARAVCGRKSKGWVWGSGKGETCRDCAAKR